MEKRICPACGQPVTGRKDKKYCSEACRHAANNQLRSEQLTTNISQTLRNNRRILKTLCPQGKATVRKNVLDEMGYDFSLFTSLFLTQNRQVYYLCYDYGFAPLSDDHGVKRVLIISRQPYMTGWDPWKHLRKPDENKSVPGNA